MFDNSPVIKYDVWQPNFITRDANFLQAIVITWVPFEAFIFPFLKKENNRKENDENIKFAELHFYLVTIITFVLIFMLFFLHPTEKTGQQLFQEYNNVPVSETKKNWIYFAEMKRGFILNMAIGWTLSMLLTF